MSVERTVQGWRRPVDSVPTGAARPDTPINDKEVFGRRRIGLRRAGCIIIFGVEWAYSGVTVRHHDSYPIDLTLKCYEYH